MSLKNSVGTVPRTDYAYMRELHSSPYQRQMIAEINTAYNTDLIVLDGVVAFVDGGPATGTRVDAGVMLAGSDRVAIDAVGLAVLKDLGSNETIMGRKIFEQDQMKRAVEIGLGISDPKQIEIIAKDSTSLAYAEKLKSILNKA